MNIRTGLPKALLKFTGWILGSILLFLAAFHLWFIYHSEQAIEDLVTWQSNGKMTAVMKKFRIDYFNNEIEIKGLAIFNTDTLQKTSYRFTAQNFRFKIRSKWDWVFHKQLEVDSILFNSPDIVITNRGASQHDTTKKKLVLAEELGNVYKTISQSLSVLQLQHFEITEGKVLIKDANSSDSAPFMLSHIFFTVNELNTTVANAGKFIFSDRVTLRIAGQEILLPDNKSNIAFKELKIDSKEKYIQITEPRINIFPSATQKSSFIGSAHSLNITGLDFDVLYKEPLLKIDSVFMESPNADLELYTDEQNKKAGNKKRISIDSALLHLPVAVDINHVVIQNANGFMRLNNAGKTTSFQTKNDNLSIVDMRINDTAANILSIGGFNYTIRNYTGYTPDSVYRFRFDSLQFINDKIVLYNLTAVTIKKSSANFVREYAVPRFEITDMDWLSFIFYNHFKARSAVLYNAFINVEKSNAAINQRAGKKSFYQVLSVLDNILDLDELKIINGDFAFKQGNNLNLALHKLNLDINANQLTEAKTFNQLIGSVKEVSFDTAIITNSAMAVHIEQSSFNNKDESLQLKNVLLNTVDNNVTASLNGVTLSDFSFDNDGLDVNGIGWKNGTIHFLEDVQKPNKMHKQIKTPAFILNGIAANNTTIFFDNGQTTAQANLKTISANSLSKSIDDPFKIDGLFVAGDSATINMPDSKLKCGAFVVSDKKKSTLQNISFEQKLSQDTALIKVSSLDFIPSVNETITNNTITVDSVEVAQPKIFLSLEKDKNHKQKQPIAIPKLNIKDFVVKDALLQLYAADRDNKTTVTSEKLSFGAQNIFTQNDKTLVFNNIDLHTSGNSSYIKNDTIIIKNDAGININASKFLFYPETTSWQMQLDKLNVDSVTYSSGKAGNQTTLGLYELNVFNTAIANADLQQPLPWLINKSNATIEIGSLYFDKNDLDFSAGNLQFNQNKKHLTIGSFYIDPGQSRQHFISRLTFRKDYMQASSQKITIDGIRLDKGLWNIPSINIDKGELNVYSDKFKKAPPETPQPLPTTALKNIHTAFKIDTLTLNNMTANYNELNAETKQTGHVYFNHIDGRILNIASKPLPFSDSLRINISADFLDTIKMYLQLSESYNNPQAGLCLQVQLGHADIRLLNPFLAPLTSMEAKFGYLDTMSMVAYGNAYSSHGTMRMYYHKLKASILDSGNTQQQKFGTKLLTFFANDLAIRNNNAKRYSNFNFVRNANRSSISYFLKMIVEGAAGNIAPVTKIIYRKEYKKEIKNSPVKANK